MILLFSNNASTTLQSGINSTATLAVLAAGTGSEFPAPGAGEAFYLTFKDAATQETYEIVLVTNRSGDVITIVRAQQGSTAEVWNAGDIAAQLVTAAEPTQMIQPDQLQSALYTACVATGTNGLTATLDSQLSALPDHMAFTVEAAAANTGAVTLTLTLGTTVLAAHSIVKNGGSNLNAGDIPAAGAPIELVWSATLGAYVMTNPASGTAGSLAGGALNEIPIQSAPGTTVFIPAPTVAGQVLAFIGGVVAWAAAAVTSFNGRSGAVVPAGSGTDYTAAMVEAIPDSAFQAPNVSTIGANPGFICFPDGAGGISWIHQAGSRSVTPNTPTAVAFGKIFPHSCKSVVVSCNNQTSAIRVDTITTSGFVVDVNATNITWMADGD